MCTVRKEQKMREKKVFFKRILPVILVLILAVTGVPANALRGITDNEVAAISIVSAASVAEKNGLTDEVTDGTILHAWCWSFNTIKENMKDIASAGYTAVQTSPANHVNESNKGMHLDGDGNWWWQYQPTDWKIGNYQMGTRDDFIEMCNEAHKYGVKVIVDVVPNHTTPALDRVSQELINAAGGKDNLYHANGFNNITNYSDRYQCTTGEMGGLPSVNTENKGFQKYFLQYINDLIACGCDGFRYDTAKHIGVPGDPTDSNSEENDFWPVVTGEKSVDGVSLSNKDNLFIYGEILQDNGIPYGEYAKYMRMTASSYGSKLRGQIKNNNFSVDSIMDWNHSEYDRLVTWVESHDTYCNEHESAFLTDEQIRLAWAVIAARENGTPLFYNRPDGSNGSVGNYWGNNVLGAKGNDQFKAPEVVAVNFFRNAMTGENEMLRNPNGNSKILQIDRGSKGTCIINLDEKTTLTNVTTSLEDGSYTDQVSGRIFTVSDGKLSGQLDARKVAVIYNSDREELAITPVTGFNTFQDTLQVKLTARNLINATYTTSENVTGSFESGDTITIGANSQYGDTVTVTLKATGKNGEITVSENFKKQKSVIDGSYDIYAKRPSEWENILYCYAYQSDGTQNASWPGIKMDALGDDIYGYNLPDGWKTAKVIFSDGIHQMPASYEPGFDYNEGTSMLFSDGAFTELDEIQKNEEKAVDDLVLLNDDNVFLETENFVFNGQAKEPVVTVKNNEIILAVGVDYDVSYRNNINAGNKEAENAPTVTVSGKGSYTGTVEKSFTINQANSPTGAPASSISAGQEDVRVGDIGLNANWQWNALDAEKELISGETVNATAIYTGNDVDNYIIKSVIVEITKPEADSLSEETKKSENSNTNQNGSGDGKENESTSGEVNGTENNSTSEIGIGSDKENGTESNSTSEIGIGSDEEKGTKGITSETGIVSKEGN